MSVEKEILDVVTVRGGYFNTDDLQYPEGSLAPGSYNVLLTNAETLRPFKGLQGSGTGGRAMFTLANGYGSINDIPAVAATGTVTLTGGAGGSVNGITVNGVQIMSGAVSYVTSLSATATAVASNINAYASTPNYTANAVGAVITITSPVTGTSPNGYVVPPSFTTLTGTSANMSGGAAAVTAYGSLFNFINESLWFAGVGDVYFNGSDTGFNASSSIQLSAKSGGTYSTAYTAGLAEPDAPTVAAKTPGIGFTGLMTGLYSFKIARVRGLTGAVSIASATSSTVSCSGSTVRLTFPALAANGQDRWAIFATLAGFGGTGVHYLLQEIADTDLATIDGVARSYEVEFADSDLLPVTAYIDDYPPPSCTFAGRLEDYTLAIGCYDNAIAVSIRNFPESFNPEHLAFLPEAPTAVLPDQIGSYIYVATEQSVHAVSVTFAENPLVVQTVWSNVGVAHAHNWCSVDGVIFAFVSKQGAVTMDGSGNPSNLFAIPVAKAMKDWAVTDTTVFADPNTNSVIYCNGSTAISFNLQTQKWSAPVITTTWATGSIVSGAVYSRQLKITILNGTTFSLYNWDTATATPTPYRLVTPDKILNIGGRFTVLGIKAGYHHSDSSQVTFSCYTDYGTLPARTFAHTGVVGANTTKETRWFLPRKEAYRMQFDATQTTYTNDSYLTYIVIYGSKDQSNIY